MKFEESEPCKSEMSHMSRCTSEPAVYKSAFYTSVFFGLLGSALCKQQHFCRNRDLYFCAYEFSRDRIRWRQNRIRDRIRKSEIRKYVEGQIRWPNPRIVGITANSVNSRNSGPYPKKILKGGHALKKTHVEVLQRSRRRELKFFHAGGVN
jgi:hypothetical protein